MHYEVTWEYRLRVTQSCEVTASVNPCFATYACLCDNGYFSIAEVMPPMPDTYDGIKEYVNVEEEEESLEVKVTEDEDTIIGLDSDLFYALVGVLVLLVVVIGLCICICKRRQSSKSTIRPQDGKIQTLEFPGVGVIEKNMVGALTNKKRLKNVKIDSYPQVSVTNDEMMGADNSEIPSMLHIDVS